MGLFAKIKEDIDDVREGFNEAMDRDEEVTSSAERAGKMTAGVSRVALFGFLAAMPGVPFLPWGKPWAIAATVVVGALGAINLHNRPRAQIYRAVPVFVISTAVLRLDAPTTSMVLVGAFITTAAGLAKNYPMVYGIFTGMAIGALAVKISDANLFNAQQLPLSGKPFTPDRGAAEGLRLAGFLFLTAILNFSAIEMERFKSKAKAAEAARADAVVDERARIARELHDVVSHHVTAMTLQAEAASMTGDKTALSSVATAGREALTELRRMLGVLRRPQSEDGDDLDPQPDLGQLDTLAQRASSGPQVRIDRRGDVRPLSAGLELGVYRLVQEALTNSAKHSDATTVEVVLDYGETDLNVDVVDNGRSLVTARVGSGGLGLVGMQERIALLNGELSTGPRRDAPGYRVHARLPIDQ